MTAHSRAAASRRGPSPAPAPSRGGIYLGIIGLLLVMVVALVGGIIWYNSTKTNELVIASAERLILETDEKVRDRLKLLYDPMYAIVSLASQSPPLHSPAIKNDARTKGLFLRALRVYPQVLALYVGFDNGEFFEIVHVGGDANKTLRARLGAPDDAVFANEFVDLEADGRLKTRWEFLAEDGSIIGRRDTAPDYDPRTRPWYESAKQNEEVVRSDLYVFASTGDPGFTLSRRFAGSPDGVMGADLAVVELAHFLSEQDITASSKAFIFTKAGDIVAAPRPPAADGAGADERTKTALPKVTDMDDPVIKGLVDTYDKHLTPGTRAYNVAGRTYIGRVSELPPRYGPDELLAIMVPVDEIVSPVIKLRNETLFYSLAFLVFALPLYITIVVHLIDRRLGRHTSWPQRREED